jgi:hypothetical protein
MTLAARALAAVMLRNRRIVRGVSRTGGVGIRDLRCRARDVRLQSNRQLESQKRKKKAGE